MADQLNYSLWLRGFTALNMLPAFRKALDRFPFSRLRPVATLRVHAIEFTHAPVLERRFEEDIDGDEVIEAANEFLNTDCAYELDTYWDLFQQNGDEWKLAPAAVTLSVYGPLFDSELGEQMRVCFGPDNHYVPEDGPSLRPLQANIRSVLQLAADLDDALPLDKKLLWSEGDDNFAERLEAALEEVV